MIGRAVLVLLALTLLVPAAWLTALGTNDTPRTANATHGPTPPTWAILDGQAPAGGPWAAFNHGLVTTRDIQGDGPDLDIGGGSTNNPGDVVFQHDVGTGRVIFEDGHKGRVMAVGPDRIRAHKPIHVSIGGKKVLTVRRGRIVAHVPIVLERGLRKRR